LKIQGYSCGGILLAAGEASGQGFMSQGRTWKVEWLAGIRQAMAFPGWNLHSGA